MGMRLFAALSPKRRVIWHLPGEDSGCGRDLGSCGSRNSDFAGRRKERLDSSISERRRLDQPMIGDKSPYRSLRAQIVSSTDFPFATRIRFQYFESLIS